MARRIERRYKKYLGSRRWGGGNVKSRRGKGSRGGKGRAGSHKHRWTWTVKYEPERFGKVGFVPLKRPAVGVINVGRIAELAHAGALKKEEGLPTFIFEGKILGAGEIDVPVSVTAAAFSEGAKKKIEAAGGKAISSRTAQEEKKEGEVSE